MAKDKQGARWIAASSGVSTLSANISDFLVAVEIDNLFLFVFPQIASHQQLVSTPSQFRPPHHLIVCCPKIHDTFSEHPLGWPCSRELCFVFRLLFIATFSERTVITFQVHSSLKQRFSSSTVLIFKQATRVQTGISVVCWLCRLNKLFDWLNWVELL